MPAPIIIFALLAQNFHKGVKNVRKLEILRTIVIEMKGEKAREG